MYCTIYYNGQFSWSPQKNKKEGGGGGSTGYGRNILIAVGKYEEGTRAGLGETCEYTVVGTAVPAAPDGGRSEAEWRKGGDIG